ncbi:MAG: DUF2851 family protein [Nitritalea sp.]
MLFKEDFLHFVWRFLYFHTEGLRLVDGQTLQVQRVGFYNQHDGPDFLEAHVLIDGLLVVGHIEIHTRSSDWYRHGHQGDARYEQVVLHVVWEEDRQVVRSNGTALPTLILKDRVKPEVIEKYETFKRQDGFLLCQEFLPQLSEIVLYSAMEVALHERYLSKVDFILALLERSKGDWELVSYWWLFYCFGFKLNQLPMLELAQIVSLADVRRLGGSRMLSIYALYFGSAGLLPLAGHAADSYVRSLQEEYLYLAKKHRLRYMHPSILWRRKGVRPPNFPGRRLAQAIAYLLSLPNIWDGINQAEEVFLAHLAAGVNQVPGYWHTHFDLGRQSDKKGVAGLSRDSLERLSLNIRVPLWFAYARYMQQDGYRERAIDLLMQYPAERNKVTRIYTEAGFPLSSAFDAQGVMGLYQHFCSAKGCLQCKIGQAALRPKGPLPKVRMM